MAELEHWQMWRERCALARCSAIASRDLTGFAFDRFRRFLVKSGQVVGAPKATDAWHAFESHLALGRQRSAKAWKEWLFARGGQEPTIDCVQGGATLIMRVVVREYLRREHAPIWMRSLDSPVGQGAEPGRAPISLEDLLPDADDPISTIEQQESQELAERLFPRVSHLLSPRESIAVATHHAAKSLNHPSVTEAAKCCKSSLCNALHKALQRLAKVLQATLPDEEPCTRLMVASLLIEKIALHSEKKLEREHPELFRYIKEETAYAC